MIVLNGLVNEPLANNKERIACFEQVLQNINDENAYLNELFNEYTQELAAAVSVND